MRIILITCFTFFFLKTFAQVDTTSLEGIQNDASLLKVDYDGMQRSDSPIKNFDPPSYKGGATALLKHLDENLQYPEKAKTNNISGVVSVQFLVDTIGVLSNVKVLKGLGYGCDEAALTAIKSMPPWIPAKVNGRPIASTYTLPVRFKMKESIPNVQVSPQFYKDDLGEELLESKKYKEALQRLKIVYRGDPSNPAIHLQMGQAKLGLGKVESACKSFQKAKELGNEEADNFIRTTCGSE